MGVARKENPHAICKTNLRPFMSSEFNLAGDGVVRQTLSSIARTYWEEKGEQIGVIGFHLRNIAS